MNKSNFFAGQPIFSQIIKSIPQRIITSAVGKFKTDRYYKKFDTYHHLISLLYGTFQHCTSLREIESGMRACEGRLQSVRLVNLPARSTLSEANKNRSYEVFEDIYQGLYKHFRQLLPDSRSCSDTSKRLIIIDSTTIQLFQEILKSAGPSYANGRRKGGIKVHTAIRANENVPFLIKMTASAASDIPFMKQIPYCKGAIVVMDRGYKNYKTYNMWKTHDMDWVTRKRDNAIYEHLYTNELPSHQKMLGVLEDKVIRLGHPKKEVEKVDCRLIVFKDKATNKTFDFITSSLEIPAGEIANIYKRRWDIETLFKRLKQNTTLNYFWGDNENAIKIQIYVALIADLLMKVITLNIKRKWSFSNLASIIRLHLMNYTNLILFLNNPLKAKIENPYTAPRLQLRMNLSG